MAPTITLEDLIMQGHDLPSIPTSQFLYLLIPDYLHSSTATLGYTLHLLPPNIHHLTNHSFKHPISYSWSHPSSFLAWPYWAFRSMDPCALVFWVFCFCLYFWPPFPHTGLDSWAHHYNYPVANMLGLLNLFFHRIYLQAPSPGWTSPSTSPVSMPEQLSIVTKVKKPIQVSITVKSQLQISVGSLHGPAILLLFSRKFELLFFPTTISLTPSVSEDHLLQTLLICPYLWNPGFVSVTWNHIWAKPAVFSLLCEPSGEHKAFPREDELWSSITLCKFLCTDPPENVLLVLYSYLLLAIPSLTL